MWGAHEADGRIAARNATKIRAALRNSLDAKRVFENYLTTHPAVSDNQAQDRARARSWALLHLRINNEALKQALLRLYAEAWVTGDAVAGEEVNLATREQKKSVTILKSDMATIDWSKWEPGDAASAMLLDPPKAFRDLVKSSGALIQGLDKTGYELVGTALADSIRLGLSPAKAAKIINLQISNPARALTIAVTESSRVMNASAINRYKQMGIEQVKWMPVLSVVGGGKACDKCAENNGQIVTMGSSFNSGATQPPQHPHCRCNLLPVIPDYANMPNENGVVDVAPQQTSIAQKPSIAQATERVNRAKILTRPQADAWFKQNNQLIPNDIAGTLMAYTQQEYAVINKTLRGIKLQDWQDTPERRKKTKKQIKDMEEIFNTVKPTREDLIVYRGIRKKGIHEQDIIDKLNPGTVFTDEGFISASFDKKIAQEFKTNSNQATGVIIKIVIPKGSKLVAPKSLLHDRMSLTLHDAEQEVILNKGTSFTVLSRTKQMITVIVNE